MSTDIAIWIFAGSDIVKTICIVVIAVCFLFRLDHIIELLSEYEYEDGDGGDDDDGTRKPQIETEQLPNIRLAYGHTQPNRKTGAGR